MIDVFYHLPQNSGKFGQNVNGKTINFWLDQPENFKNKWNILLKVVQDF